MISPEDVLLRLGLATLLGGAVGLERGMQEQSAGLRTHALVAVGATLFMVVSAQGLADSGATRLDPSRIAAQVVSGVGFLGAGAIIQQRQSVRGLTTAASIWAVAAIGLAVGCGLYLASAATTGLILFLLAVLKPVERRLRAWQKTGRRPIVVHIERGKAGVLASIENAARAANVRLEHVHIRSCADARQDCVELSLAGGASHGALLALLDALRALPGVQEISAFAPPGSPSHKSAKPAAAPEFVA